MVGEGTCLSPTPYALHSLYPLLPAKIILNIVNPSAAPNQSPAHCCLTAQPLHWHCSQPSHCQPPQGRNRKHRIFILQTTTLPGWLCSKVSLPVLLSPSSLFQLAIRWIVHCEANCETDSIEAPFLNILSALTLGRNVTSEACLGKACHSPAGASLLFPPLSLHSTHTDPLVVPKIQSALSPLTSAHAAPMACRALPWSLLS